MSNKIASALGAASFVVLGALSANAQTAAPATATTGCYTPSGTVYVTNLPGAPTDCHSNGQSHTPIVWGAGATGAAGAQGIQGVKGDKGDTGAQGAQGEKGATGEQGAKGDQGIQGIQGVQGDKGLTGDQGAKGDQGLKGDQGIQGVKGDKGEKGDKGDQGVQGIQGVQGAKGDQGIQGTQGIQGIQGIAGLSGLERIVLTATGETVTLTCPAGKKILSGGYIAPSNANILVQNSYPSSLTTWIVQVKNSGSARTDFQGWALCAFVP